MAIACLGWGSLVWRPETLPLRSAWFADGPSLPIEFARKSNNGRITLVIVDGVEPIPVLWSEMDAGSVDEAVMALADREGIAAKNANRLIGIWTAGSGPQTVADWATQKELDAVIWTALGPKFSGGNDTPTADQVVAYLRDLVGPTRECAEEYVRRAPAQIMTAYRTAIEAQLGWTALPG